jgi:xeroderma pigmentosum group C-complementing protein
MPPKRSGRPRKLLNGPDRSTEEIFDIISISDSSDSAVIMVEKKPVVRGTGKGKGKDTTSGIPNIYREMLAEALPLNTGISERPLKKRKVGPPNEVSSTRSGHPDDIDDEDDDDLEFEDVLGPRENIQKPQQTAYRDSDDDSGTDLEIGNFDFDENSIDEKPSGDLELTLTAKPVPQRQATIPRRKAITNVERALRLQTHKMHVLCLLSFSDRRNEWCNDPLVQNSLKPLLNQRMLTFLRPREELSQFGRAESLKRGLDGVSIMWRTKFTITARGARRSLWADDERDVQNVCTLLFHRVQFKC